MKLGKDFFTVARILIAVLKAILQLFEGENEDSPGDGSKLK